MNPRLQTWLSERTGAETWRRVASHHGGRIVLSRFEPGFAAGLFDRLDSLPALFDPTAVSEAMRAAAGEGAPDRVEAWRRGMETIVRTEEQAGRLTAEERAEVMGGIDSVAALLDAVLWTRPEAGSPHEPEPGERAARDDVLARMVDGSIFTRYFGEFEGESVVAYCPGAQYARRLFDLAWNAAADVGESSQ